GEARERVVGRRAEQGLLEGPERLARAIRLAALGEERSRGPAKGEDSLGKLARLPHVAAHRERRRRPRPVAQPHVAVLEGPAGLEPAIAPPLAAAQKKRDRGVERALDLGVREGEPHALIE